jgi:hypothetical protein
MFGLANRLYSVNKSSAPFYLFHKNNLEMKRLDLYLADCLLYPVEFDIKSGSIGP